MIQTLETERLLLMPWTPDDVGLLSNLGRDPRVVRYIGRGHPWTAAEVLEVSDAQVDHWREHGFGWRVAMEKRTGEPIGFMALNIMHPDITGLEPQIHDIGWWLNPTAWGQGYAKEGAGAVRDHAFTTLAAPHLTARIRPANAASIGVSLSLGMTHLFDTTGRHGEAVSIFRRDAPA